MEKFLRLNLQYFSEENDNSDKEGSDAQDKKEGKDDSDDKQDKPLTLDQVQKLIQSETDKVRTSYSKELKALQAERDELKKSQMSAQEKADFEKQQYETQLKERETKLMQKEMEFHTLNELTRLELPPTFQPFLVGKDQETTDKNIEAFNKAWNDAIGERIQSKYKENGRDVKKAEGSGEITKEQFQKMGYSDRVKLANENPELYRKLRG